MNRTIMLNLKKPKTLITIGVIATVLLIIVIVFVTQQITGGNRLAAKPTNLTLDATLTPYGENIRVFNGAAFYDIGTQNNSKPKLVYSLTARLPHIKSVSYADNHGALLTFDGGIANTPVFDYKFDNDLDLTDNNNYTWFLDFKTDKLTLVGRYDTDSSTVAYDSTARKFYYIVENDSGVPGSLYSYNVDTHTASHITKTLNLTQADSLSMCEQSLCLIGQQFGNPSSQKTLYALSKKGDKEPLEYVNGDIKTTSNNQVYALYQDKSKDEEGQPYSSYSKLALFSVSEKKSFAKYSGTFTPDSSTIAELNSDNSFYYMNGLDDTYTQLANRSHDKELTYDESLELDQGFINLGLAGDNYSLIANTDREVYIVGDPSVIKQPFHHVAEAEAKDITSACAQKANGTTVQYDDDDPNKAIILVLDGDKFNSRINTINSCLTKNPSSLIGYSYIYRGVSGDNRRLTTD